MSRAPDGDWLAALAQRLREAVGNDSAARVAERTRFGIYGVRRHLRGTGVPSLPFLITVSQVYGVSLEWLGTGRGMRREGDYARALLGTATLSELAHAIEDRLAALQELDPASDCPQEPCPMAGRVRARNAALL